MPGREPIARGAVESEDLAAHHQRDERVGLWMVVEAERMRRGALARHDRRQRQPGRRPPQDRPVGLDRHRLGIRRVVDDLRVGAIRVVQHENRAAARIAAVTFDRPVPRARLGVERHQRHVLLWKQRAEIEIPLLVVGRPLRNVEALLGDPVELELGRDRDPHVVGIVGTDMHRVESVRLRDHIVVVFANGSRADRRPLRHRSGKLLGRLGRFAARRTGK